MHAVAQWATHHDSAKLLLFALGWTLVILTLFGLGESPLLVALMVSGLALCAVVAYWLGNRKWLLIPLVAMLVFVAVAVPAVMLFPNGGESPVSMVLESPFWAGLPALLGAGAGMALYSLVHARGQRRG